MVSFGLNKSLHIMQFNAQSFKSEKDIINSYYEHLEDERERLHKNVVENKNWLEKQPIMQDFLNKLQFMLQEKNISFFNSLMTALSNDVIHSNNASEDKPKEINFDLSVKNGMPALKINAKTFDNNFEKITSGGLKNVIATGLRVLALWRLTVNENTSSHKGEFSHRKFIFMDEPDCWIGNQSMPNYAKLLGQLAEHFNLQILMVTHKDVDYFKPYAKVYELKNNGFVSLNLLSDIEHNESKEDYIESVHLQNFKSFKDSKIELNPKLTVIVGKSDTGKSVIMEAFNAVLNNQSDDDVIRHFENKASVNITLYNKAQRYNVLWERVRKTNTDYPQKVRYRLYSYNSQSNQNDLLSDEFNSHNTPEQIISCLKMKKLDNVDIHLGTQDDMTFLFNPRISDQERAKILSLGKESSYIHKMMDGLKSKTREKRAEIKINEKRYNLLTDNISTLFLIDPENAEYNELIRQEQEISQLTALLNEIDGLIKQYCYAKSIEQLKLPENNLFEYSLVSLKEIEQLISHLSYLVELNKVSEQFDNELKEIHSDIVIEDIAIMDNLIGKIEELKLKENIYGKTIKDIDSDEICFSLNDLSLIDKIGINIKKCLMKKDDLENSIQEKDSALKKLKEQIKALEHKMKICPLCQNKFSSIA